MNQDRLQVLTMSFYEDEDKVLSTHSTVDSDKCGVLHAMKYTAKRSIGQLLMSRYHFILLLSVLSELSDLDCCNVDDRLRKHYIDLYITRIEACAQYDGLYFIQSIN